MPGSYSSGFARTWVDPKRELAALKFYANLETNCVPIEAIDMDFNSYEQFLDMRRKLMAAKIKKYYYSL